MSRFILSMTFIAMTTLWSGMVAAGECEIQYTRIACSGQEDMSYKKCDGKQSCSKVKQANSVEECRKKATKSCRNKRLTVTKSKVINALFDGKKITTESGKDDFCLEYANAEKEFNKC